MRLLPREEKFFSLFLLQIDIICEASQIMLEGAKAGNSQLVQMSEQIRVLEGKGDDLIHDIFTRLNQTFITPLDPEDIHSLSSSLDDVLDGIEDAAHRMVSYRLEPIPPTIVELFELIHKSSESLQKAFRALEAEKPLTDHLIEVNRLEHEADELVRKAIKDLFDHETDPIRIIKVKEVLEFLEATTDSCEDVADVLQAVVVKNS